MRFKMSSRLFVFGIILVLVTTTFACTSPEATTEPTTTTPTTTPFTPITLVFSDHEPAGSYWETDVAGPYFEEIERRTNGRVKIEQHYGGELAGLFDVYDAVLKGTVDVAKILPTMFADKFPYDGIMIFQPVNIKTYRAGQVWMDLYNKYPEMQAQYEDTPLLGFAPMPCAGLATTGKEIHKWEDAQGLKMPGAGPAPESRQTAVGIVPVSIEPPDVYMAFKTGTLDGMALALISLIDFGWADVLPYVSMVNLNGGPWAYVMNKDTWNSLPPDIQQVFIDMAPFLTETNDRVQYEQEQIAMSKLEDEYGTTIIRLSQEELDRWAEQDMTAMDAYLTEWVSDIGAELRADFLALHEKYAQPEYSFD